MLFRSGMQSTDNKLIYIGKPIKINEEVFKEQLGRLKYAMNNDDLEIRKIVGEIVETYQFK